MKSITNKNLQVNHLQRFNRTLNRGGRLFSQDGDPRHVSQAGKNAI